jgi:hypothetical protein
MRAVGKGQACRHSIQVAAEDGPEHSTSDDKVLPVSLKIKPLSPRPLVRREVLEEALHLRWRLVQGRSPDMNLIAS